MYKYIPDTYDMQITEKLNIDYDTFLKMQIKYRESFEQFLKLSIDFKKIDDYINSNGFHVPIIEDKDYNFYHKYSILGSQYIFLRNNIHVELLSQNEMKEIINSLENNAELSKEFILQTFKKVLFESGDSVFYGIPMDGNLVNSKGIVFEFAYNDALCSIEQGMIINRVWNEIYTKIKSILEKVLESNVYMIKYDGFGDLYKLDDFENLENLEFK